MEEVRLDESPDGFMISTNRTGLWDESHTTNVNDYNAINTKTIGHIINRAKQPKQQGACS